MGINNPEFQPYWVLVLSGIAFFVIYMEWVKPTVGLMVLILVFMVYGVIGSKELLSGFSNESIGSIVLLILISAGLRSNYNVEALFDKIFKKIKSYRGFLLAMMSQMALLSSFVNNTPVVVLMTPYVYNWGKRNGISPSKLLIPLSFATIMGGMITLIGTSTTLVLNGFMTDFGLPGLISKELLITGVCVTLGGILFITLTAKKLLPDHSDVIDKFEKNRREYLIEKRLSPDSQLIGKSIANGGLRNLRGVYLVEIIRENVVISPVPPTEIIQSRDILIFAGNTKDVVDLSASSKDLVLPPKASAETKQVNIIEAVISTNSSLIGKTIKESMFRNRYDAAVVAIHRNGEKLSGKIGDIALRPGDSFLLYAGDDFHNRVDLYRDLYIISEERKIVAQDYKATLILGLLILLTISLLVSGAFSLFLSLLIIFGFLVIVGMITLKHVKRDLDVNMLIILILSLCLGEAIINSGAGDLAGGWLVSTLQPYGKLALLSGMMVLTVILTSFISNVGAVAITFPLAYSISQSMGLVSSPFYLAIAFAASASFITPIGYQTNLIIFGPGGYKFKDFIKIGAPLTVLYLLIVLVCIYFLYPEFWI